MEDYSVLRMEHDKTTSTRFVIGLQSHACSWNRFVQVGVYGGGLRAGSGHEDSNATY
jgi:hypothetical protein